MRRRSRSRSRSPRGGGRSSRRSRTPSPPPRGSRMRSDHPQRADRRSPMHTRLGPRRGRSPPLSSVKSTVSRPARSHHDYASPSPPRSRRGAGAPAPADLRVTSSSDGSRKTTEASAAVKRAVEELDELDAGRRYPARGSRTKCDSGHIFRGPEFEEVDLKEQRKIQIDIRRSIPSHRVSHSPIRRDIEDPKRVILSRRADEGVGPIFDRDEIKLWIPSDPEKRVVNMVGGGDQRQREADRRRRADRAGGRRSPSPLRSSSSSRHDRGDVRSRLGKVATAGGRGHDEGRLRSSAGHRDSPSVKDRLGARPRGGGGHDDRMLDREELESLRPDTKPWDINPEYVPRGRNYYEHDNRDSYDDSGENFGGGGFYRGGGFRGRGRGGFRGRGGGFRGRGGGFDSPKWKHDLFEQQQEMEEEEEPSSTTAE